MGLYQEELGLFLGLVKPTRKRQAIEIKIEVKIQLIKPSARRESG